MEIERLGENKIRCALSEEEIREMGYNIDEIIGNTEVTQEFMRAVVESGRHCRTADEPARTGKIIRISADE